MNLAKSIKQMATATQSNITNLLVDLSSELRTVCSGQTNEELALALSIFAKYQRDLARIGDELLDTVDERHEHVRELCEMCADVWIDGTIGVHVDDWREMFESLLGMVSQKKFENIYDYAQETHRYVDLMYHNAYITSATGLR